MASSQFEDDFKAKLELAYEGSGPRPPRRTAIGLFDNDNHMDSTVLPDAPWWFDFIDPFVRLNYNYVFMGLDHKLALTLLEEAKVPPLYRLGLGIRWQFIDSSELSICELELIMHEMELLDESIEKELDKMESRCSYQLWRKFKTRLRDRMLELAKARLDPPASFDSGANID